MSGSPNMTKRLPLPVFFEIGGHVEVGVHARFEYGNLAQLLEFGGVGFVVEGAGDEQVKGAVGGLAGGGRPVRGGRRCRIRGPMKMAARRWIPFSSPPSKKRPSAQM